MGSGHESLDMKWTYNLYRQEMSSINHDVEEENGIFTTANNDTVCACVSVTR